MSGFHRISLTSTHFAPPMVMKLILLRKFEKCQEIFSWLQNIPFCSICAVFRSISISICEICTHFTRSKLRKLPIYNQNESLKETFDFLQFILIWSIGAVFYSVMSSFYIIFLVGSHFTCSRLTKIPMQIKFARSTGTYHEKFSFLTIYAIMQYLGSISQYCEKWL